MPIYYFDLLNSDGLTLDDNGSDLPDLRAAQVNALRTATDVAREHKPEGAPHRVSVQVRDAADRRVAEVVLTVEVHEP
jgi:hypothetical protein